ncbi:MAG: hypothetical protein PHR16_01645 [Methylovulum sp.]|nr:hypothetical protein [Methylovulum sp.]
MDTKLIGLLAGIPLFSIYAAESHLAEAAKTHARIADEHLDKVSKVWKQPLDIAKA